MRKSPRQGRSRATVEAIVQAGAHILGAEGWAGFTTNTVADLAGVSIGSLYQYFPDKLSLVDAIRRRHLDDCLAILRETRTEGISSKQFAANLARAMIAAHSERPGLHRALLDEAPNADGYRDHNSAFETKYLAFYAEAVRAYGKHKSPKAVRVGALVLSDAIDGVVHNAARRGMLDDRAIESELTKMISLYLSA